MKSFTRIIKWLQKRYGGFFVRKPQMVIESHFYHEEVIQIKIRDKKGGVQIHHVQHVARKKEIIDQLSANDALLLGYLLAEQDQENSFVIASQEQQTSMMES